MSQDHDEYEEYDDDPAGLLPEMGFEQPAVEPTIHQRPHNPRKGRLNRLAGKGKKDKSTGATRLAKVPRSRPHVPGFVRRLQPFNETTFIELDPPAGALIFIVANVLLWQSGYDYNVLGLIIGLAVAYAVVLLTGAILHQHYQHNHGRSLAKMLIAGAGIALICAWAVSSGHLSDTLWGLMFWLTIPGPAVRLRESKIAARRSLEEEAKLQRRLAELNDRELQLNATLDQSVQIGATLAEALAQVQTVGDQNGSTAMSLARTSTALDEIVRDQVQRQVAQQVADKTADARQQLEAARTRLNGELTTARQGDAAQHSQLREEISTLRAQNGALTRDNQELREELNELAMGGAASEGPVTITPDGVRVPDPHRR